MRELLHRFQQQAISQRQLVLDGKRREAGVALTLRFWRDTEGRIRCSVRLRTAQLYDDPITADELLRPHLDLDPVEIETDLKGPSP